MKSMSARAQKPFNLILLGDPASGKGTQAARLAKKYRFYDLDMGREVRKPAARARYDYAKTTAIGKLTPTAVVRDIFKRVIAAAPARKGILFNGTPKMINEAKLVARELARAKRARPARHLSHASRPARCSSARRSAARDDDSMRALHNRQKYYKEQITRVVAFFGERYTVKTISGMGTEAAVEKKIEAIIRHHLAKWNIWNYRTPQEIKIMAEGGRRLGAVLQRLKAEVRPGVTTLALDRVARKLIVDGGDTPAFLNYRPEGARHAYPYTLCASVNNVVVHGQPSKYVSARRRYHQA